jgi:membrane protein DedA with SNARE-associated domain
MSMPADASGGHGRWWVPPAVRLAGVFAALAAAALVIYLVFSRVNPPSASSLIRDYGYIGVAVGAAADSFGLPSSGEIVLLLASAASAAGASHFSLPLVIAVAWGFAVLGDSCAYAIGRAAGPRVLRRFGVHEDSKVHRFMDRYAARTIVGARLLAAVRTKVAIVSGSTRVPFYRYVLFDGIGAAVWAVSVGLLGYLFAASVDRLIHDFGRFSSLLGVVAVIVIGALVVFFSVRYVLRHRPQASDG